MLNKFKNDKDIGPSNFASVLVLLRLLLLLLLLLS
jgi:hypothetical protein